MEKIPKKVKDIIDKINSTKNFWSIIPSIETAVLEKLLELASDYYYNSEIALVDDYLYDILLERLKIVNPKSSILDNVGSKVKHGDKIKLPYWMGSMDKIKGDEATLNRWTKKNKGPYVVSYKLDGISALFVNNIDNPKLYTRGNGSYGADISHLIESCNMSIENVPVNVVIRGELIISKENFNNKKTAYDKIFANSRAFVAGTINSKKGSVEEKRLARIDFVCFEIIKPFYKPLKQMKLFKKWNVNYPANDFYETINLELLDKLFINAKDNYKYETDGIIVTDNELYETNKEGNPEHSFAYKGMTATADTEVLDVIWTPSKDGILVPRIKYKPVSLSGATLQYCQGFNAAFIVKHNINIGSKITVIRSGDVNPYIINILKQSKNPLLPDVDYYWDDNEVNIILENKDDDETVKIKRILRFMKTIEVKNVSEGIITKLVSNGYDDIFKILQMTFDDFIEIEGFKETLARKVYNNIQSRINDVNTLQVIVASNLLGRGFAEKKIKKILESYPNILDEYDESERDNWEQSINEIEGFDEITIEKLFDNLPKVQEFYQELSNYVSIKFYESENNLSGEFANAKIVFTGFKNKKWKEYIENNGGSVSESVSKNTTLVVYKDGETSTGKYQKASQLGIKLMSKSQFQKKFKFSD